MPTASPEYGAYHGGFHGAATSTIGMPAALASAFANPNGWTMKTLESADDYNRSTALTALRFDGHYNFNDGFHLDFGVRNSIRSAHNEGFTLVAPVYAGMGASDPNGCLVRYVGSDVILSGNATARRQHVVYRGQLRRLLPRRPAVVAAAFENPGAARQQLSAVHQPARARESPSGRSIRTPWMIPWRTGSRSIPIPRHRRRPESRGPYG